MKESHNNYSERQNNFKGKFIICKTSFFFFFYLALDPLTIKDD